MSDWDFWNSWNFWDRKKYRSGYMDMGPQQIPVLPHKVILTDELTNVQWQVSYNLTDNTLSIIAPNLKSEGGFVYGPFEGPRFPENNDYVLSLNNETLYAIHVPLDPHVQEQTTAPIYARNGNAYRQVCLADFL